MVVLLEIYLFKVWLLHFKLITQPKCTSSTLSIFRCNQVTILQLICKLPNLIFSPKNYLKPTFLLIIVTMDRMSELQDHPQILFNQIKDQLLVVVLQVAAQ